MKAMWRVVSLILLLFLPASGCESSANVLQSNQTGDADTDENTDTDTSTDTETESSSDAPCGGVLHGGYCWYYGAPGESCQYVCVGHGGYHAATMSFAGSDGTDENCVLVADALGAKYSLFFSKPGWAGLGCHYQPEDTYLYRSLDPTTSEYTNGTARRVCACNQ